jgi:hypothetical protein
VADGIAVGLAGLCGSGSHAGPPLTLSAAKLLIEHNSTDADTGFKASPTGSVE